MKSSRSGDGGTEHDTDDNREGEPKGDPGLVVVSDDREGDARGGGSGNFSKVSFTWEASA